MKRGAVSTCALLAAAALVAPSPLHAQRKDDGSTVVRLEPYVGRLLTVSATLGLEKLTLLLDTGGGQTLITPKVAGRIGCTPRGRLIGFRMRGERVVFEQCDPAALEMAGRRLGKSTIAVWDVMSILPKDFPPLDGVLALDAFAGQAFTLELAAKNLTLESDRSLQKRIATMKRVQARIATGLSGADLTVFVMGRLEQPGWFLFDSGNLDVTIVAPHMVPGSAMAPSQPRAASLSLDGLPARTVPVAFRQIVYDGVLSEEVLRQWTWTFRLATGELWAAQAH